MSQTKAPSNPSGKNVQEKIVQEKTVPEKIAPEKIAHESNPSERIRILIDAGFASVEKARQMQQTGSVVAAAQACADVRRIVAEVGVLLPATQFTESQLGVLKKKIQALKDAAERVGGVPL